MVGAIKKDVNAMLCAFHGQANLSFSSFKALWVQQLTSYLHLGLMQTWIEMHSTRWSTTYLCGCYIALQYNLYMRLRTSLHPYQPFQALAAVEMISISHLKAVLLYGI